MSDDAVIKNNAYNIGNGKDDKVIRPPPRESDDVPWYVCLLGFIGFSSCC